MSNRRTVFILAVIFGVLVVVTLLQQNQPAVEEGVPSPTPAATAINVERVFPDLAVLDIQAIRLQNPQSSAAFTISRGQDGAWTVPDSEQTLDSEAATTIAQTIVLLPSVRSLPLEPDLDMETYGFQPNARLYIQVLLLNGDTHIVAVGAVTPSQEAYYALVDERETLYLLEAHAIAFLISTLETPPLT